MGFFGWIVVGLIVGLLARVLLPGRSPVGCLGTIFIGIAGAVIGGKVWTELFGPQRGIAWIGSILVAMLLLAIFRRLTPDDRW
jgi:uncharacterized membrane protein YeaQ/YmgE (transglycosylase-associated protein family)